MKRALVVEGGGMRGAHTCGALMALVHGGLSNFDVVAATSAGACTAAYLVSGQHHLFPNIWTKHLHDGRFINLRKLASRRSVMDLDFLIHTVFRELEPLNVEAIRNSPTRFFIVATDCETGQPVYFDNRSGSILNALKASAAMPLAYRHPVVIENRTYLDGGLSDPIPIQRVIDEGCEEIYLLLTRMEGYRKKPLFMNLLPRIYRKKYPQLAELLERRHEEYNETILRIEKGDFPARLIIIRPQAKLPVRRLTTNHAKIKAAIQQGFQETMAVLESGHPGKTFDFVAMTR